ncbi:MAG: hypothetical protein KDE23_19080 [Caldilinea sp.]|nr:hypothetical protein [Caldilinea sp.]
MITLVKIVDDEIVGWVLGRDRGDLLDKLSPYDRLAWELKHRIESIPTVRHGKTDLGDGAYLLSDELYSQPVHAETVVTVTTPYHFRLPGRVGSPWYALCGSPWLQVTNDPKEVTCRRCRELLADLLPARPEAAQVAEV